MSDDSEEDLLIAQVVTAHRPIPRRGELRYHPAWHDLSVEGRAKAHEVTRAVRVAEAALDPAGLSTTARLVLARIRAGSG